jgi:hypothetical protein
MYHEPNQPMKLSDLIFFNKKNAPLGYLKSCAVRLRFVSPLAEDGRKLSRKIVNIIKLLRFMVLLPFRLRKFEGKHCVLFVGKGYEDMRRYHIEKNTGNSVDAFIFPWEQLWYQQLRLRTLLAIAGLFVEFVGIYIVLMWRRTTKTEVDSLYYVFEHAVQLQLLDRDTHVYIYLLENYTTYLTTVYASEIIKMPNIWVIASNTPYFWRKHFSYAPHAHLVNCSRLQPQELRHFCRTHWVVAKSIHQWGLEESIQIDALTPEEPIYDIGIYSSGCWTRDVIGFRIYDQARRPEDTQEVFPAYQDFCDIVSRVATLKQHYPELKVAVYLHPYERTLLEQGIEPPYLEEVKQAGFMLEKEGKNSVESMYQVRVGIAVTSGMLLDRLNLGLLAMGKCMTRYATGFEQKKHSYYGICNCYLDAEYANICFEDGDDLYAKLTQLITVENSATPVENE